jgi:putative transposase
MSDEQNKFPNRRSVRLPTYNYASAGAYFVTICAQGHECIFGEILQGEMKLNSLGVIVTEVWLDSERVRPTLKLAQFVVMPNHLHGLVILLGDERAHSCEPLPELRTRDKVRSPRSLSSFVSGFKATSTKRVNDARRTPGLKVWQRSFFERVIRDDDAFLKAAEYILNNPMRWEFDKHNPASNR